ncbi:hypothetical protein M409DRAFT_26466 [Zasmidium cellare ATCC 36951]|uniref:CoA-transferase family III n=1 Tax=Zasmidium cellare ATCC 36951 TaxID=1080233 RepID=A0A6A6CBI6_ZASCE|nr:uncharacterized protein M409DRAFT_26466 [Zasmidium cellare ATCC 36951]KAF2163019.1 hypothetical protein M409DRAFT_26466 [Zasmidium cellare ATCC 36951]
MESNGDASDRSNFRAMDTVRNIWTGLDLPPQALHSLRLDETGHELASSYKLSHLAQSSIALSALAAALNDSHHNSTSVAAVSVPLEHASAEFATEHLYFLDEKPAENKWGPLGGLHKTKDEYVRIHDNLINHRLALLRILGLSDESTREQVAEKILNWKATDLEQAGIDNKAVIYALRSEDEWNATPQAKAVPDFSISINKISSAGERGYPSRMPLGSDRCLRGLRIVELSRIIAAPVAGKTLAAHGADVLWVTSPTLPDRPMTDIDVNRGKRAISIDLNNPKDKEALYELIKDADVFLQSYRPGSLSRRGLSPSGLIKIRPGLICANLAAWGTQGPWKENRGFDSMVQTASGMNVSEAQHFDPSSATPAKPLPLQALDHASGYLLAAGIAAAVYKRAVEGGSWQVDVTLAGTMKYLKSLGQLPGKEGFREGTKLPKELVTEDMMETKESGYGLLKAVRHSARVEGKQPGWDFMPKPPGLYEPKWL